MPPLLNIDNSILLFDALYKLQDLPGPRAIRKRGEPIMLHHPELQKPQFVSVILQNGDDRKTLECDLPRAIAFQDLAGIEFNVRFTGDLPSGCVQSAKPVTAEQMASLRFVLEELMHCYCHLAR